MTEVTATMGRPPTLKEIAEVAGVHASTVSRALRPTREGALPTAEVERIRGIAADMGYRPNFIAAGLRTQRTHTIGVVIPRLTDGVIATLCQAIEATATSAGYQILLATPPDEVDAQLQSIELLLSRQVDGLIVTSLHLGRDEMATQVRSAGVPVLTVNRAGDDALPAVTADDRAGGRLATEHLIALGHRRIGIIAGPRHASTAWRRTLGYQDALRAAGIPIDDSLIVHTEFEVEGGIAGATHLLELPDRPTAIFAVNDTAAVGALGVARDRGIRIPSDLSLVGYNDIPLVGQLPVPLTTVRSPAAQIGETAVSELLRGIDGEEMSTVTLPVSLVERRSTAAVR